MTICFLPPKIFILTCVQNAVQIGDNKQNKMKFLEDEISSTSPIYYSCILVILVTSP